MASAKLIKALAEHRVVLRKAPRVAGEVVLMFYPLMDRRTGKTTQPASVPIGDVPVEPLRRTDVTMEHLRHSNIDALVQKQAVVLL